MSRWQKAGENQLMDAFLHQTFQCEGKLVHAIVPYGVICLVVIGFPEQPMKDSLCGVFCSYSTKAGLYYVIHKSKSTIAMRCGHAVDNVP